MGSLAAMLVYISIRHEKCRSIGMGKEFWIALFVLGVFAVYVIAKILAYMRQSDDEWRQVDKSKLKTWEEDD
jgi:hypothetical protein